MPPFFVTYLGIRIICRINRHKTKALFKAFSNFSRFGVIRLSPGLGAICKFITKLE